MSLYARFNFGSGFVDRLLDLAVAIQQIPAPTFSERDRAEFARHLFEAEQLSDVFVDDIYDVYGRIPGEGDRPPLVVTAHLDSVFPIHVDLAISRGVDTVIGPGIGDNALGVAGLLGLIWGLRQGGHTLPGDVWLVANVGEEGVGDARGMHAVVDRFGDKVLAYLVLEGMALGHIFHRGMAVERYRFSLETPGGHSWVDYGQPSAIHEMARLINRLADLPLPIHPRTTLNVGVIGGGTSINTIASQATFELDLRSESEPELLKLVRQVKSFQQELDQDDLQVAIEQIGRRPYGEISPSHPLVQLAENTLRALGIRPRLNIGSTDANVPLSRNLPAICIGLTTGGSAHTREEYLNVAPLADGMVQLLNIVVGAFQELDGAG